MSAKRLNTSEPAKQDVTKYPTRLFIKCPNCERPVLAIDEDGVGDYYAVCTPPISRHERDVDVSTFCGPIYFGLHTGKLDPSSIEILDILPSTEYLAYIGWFADENMGEHYLSERAATEMGLTPDLRRALLSDGFILVRTNEEPVPMVRKKYRGYPTSDKYGTFDFNGTIFKVVGSEFFIEMLDEAVEFFKPAEYDPLEHDQI